MKSITLVLMSIMTLCLLAQETSKTCKKCSGHGFVYEYELCPSCQGRQKILCCHFHAFRDARDYHCHGSKCYSKCPTCTGLQAGLKSGYVRKKVECDKCGGEGRIVVDDGKQQIIRIKKSSVKRLLDNGIIENGRMKIVLIDDDDM